MRILFAGTPDFAATCLQALLDNPNKDYELVGVYTQPDRPAGRGRKLQASAVKNLALEAGLTVMQPEKLNTAAAQAELAAFKPDLLIVVAYGIILPEAVLAIPRLGCINVHASLLPKWRGAAPIQRALLTGDAETGVTLMQMDAGLDTGAMLLKTSLPITAQDTSASLHLKLAQQGGQALVEALPLIAQQQLKATPQDDSQATYASKLTKAEAQLNWRLSAAELDRAVRGYNPWPVAWCLNQEETLRIWAAQAVEKTTNAAAGTLIEITPDSLIIATGHGCLAITRLQLAGKPQMSVKDLLNGNPDYFQVGQVFA